MMKPVRVVLGLAIAVVGVAGWMAQSSRVMAQKEGTVTLPPTPPWATATGFPTVSSPPIQDKESQPKVQVFGQESGPVLTRPSNGLIQSAPASTVNMPAPGAHPATGIPAPVERKLQPRDFPVEGDVVQTVESGSTRQSPAVSLEWVGPPNAKLGQAVACQIVVKNTSPAPVLQVMVRNRVPGGVNVHGTEPKAIIEGNVLIWDLGTLAPNQEKRLNMNLVPETRGELACQAMVTFSGMISGNLRVREPKLVVKTTTPEKIAMGDNATLTLTASNTGDGPAEHVRLRAVLPEGLESSRGRNVDFDLGNLAPNESRSVQLTCLAKAAGSHRYEVLASADGNTSAQDAATMEITLSRLELTLNGPRLRYLDRKAMYNLRITNPGSGIASNVTLTTQMPPGFKFVAASDGGRHDFSARTVTWFLGDLTCQQTREVMLELMATSTGDHKIKANALGARGLRSETEMLTRVEGLSALLMELVDLDDPVEVGSDTSYEIRVTNTGSKTETNLQLVCSIPDKMEFRGAQGPASCRCRLEGRELIFEPLAKLAPRADATYRINVRGVAPGDLRFRARIRADGLTEAVNKEESTKVYGDEAPGR